MNIIWSITTLGERETLQGKNVGWYLKALASVHHVISLKRII